MPGVYTTLDLVSEFRGLLCWKLLVYISSCVFSRYVTFRIIVFSILQLTLQTDRQKTDRQNGRCCFPLPFRCCPSGHRRQCPESRVRVGPVCKFSFILRGIECFSDKETQGGIGWAGGTVCATGSVCTYSNACKLQLRRTLPRELQASNNSSIM